MRTNRDRMALSQKMMADRGSLATLPENVRNAYTQMNVQMRELAVSLRSRDASLEPKFQSLEQTLSVLENYLEIEPGK